MNGKKVKNKTAVILFTVLAAVLSVLSAVVLVRRTGLAEAFKAQVTRSMLFEVCVVFTLLFISGWHSSGTRVSHIIRTVVIGGFLWIHGAFIPILVSGLYVAYLCLLGNIFTGKKFSVSCFITGAAAQIVIVCLFSLAGIGGTRFFLIQSAVCFVILLILRLIRVKRQGQGNALTDMSLRMRNRFPEYAETRKAPGKDTNKLILCLLMALIGTSLLLQAGRLAIALDYDSLHYGFRSAFVLDNGGGIYQNLGSVNDVYVYPKGFEILTLPLSGFGSGAFVSAFSWWMTLVTLWMTAFIVDHMRQGRKNKRAGVAAAAVLSTVPGVMNMAVSAKTDAITLAVQLICILSFVKQDRQELWTALGAAFLSLCFKPTSFLFSFLLVLAGLGLTVCRAVRSRGNGEKIFDFSLRGLFPAILCLLAVLFVTARTVLLAGVPLTTAGTGVWNALGLELKYPFNGIAFGGGSEKSYLKRLIGVFFCPVGEDMNHVYIAWGGLIVPVSMAAALLAAVFSKKKEARAERTFLYAALILTAIASLVMIRVLWQVDGNYFVLLYALSVICAFAFAGRPADLTKVLSPAMLLGVLMCLVTNWAGVLGLTQAKLISAGYVKQAEIEKAELETEGKGEIYRILAGDPATRVLAMADQPGCFVFPCNVQSYTDLEGSGGNVKILKTLDEFKDFLDYAGTDYIYVEQNFIDVRSRASDIVGYMIEDGSLVEEASDGAGSVLYRYTGVR